MAHRLRSDGRHSYLPARCTNLGAIICPRRLQPPVRQPTSSGRETANVCERRPGPTVLDSYVSISGNGGTGGLFSLLHNVNHSLDTFDKAAGVARLVAIGAP